MYVTVVTASQGDNYRRRTRDRAVSRQTEIILTQVVEKQLAEAGTIPIMPMMPPAASAKPITPTVPPIHNDPGHRDLARRGMTVRLKHQQR